jgi:3-dehydroquinate synthase
VIERDPDETSELRFALNYGHTIGHALEAVTAYERWTHGEAVSIGISAEACLARLLSLTDDATVTRQQRLLTALGLPVRVGQLDVEAVLTAITHDKKARDGRVPFVLAPHLGGFRVVYEVPPAEIRAALRELAS